MEIKKKFSTVIISDKGLGAKQLTREIWFLLSL
jgi:hypothetical protein